MAIIKNKAVVKLVLNDDKSKKAVQKALVNFEGFTSYTLDFEKSTLVVIGDTDPIVLVYKLRKFLSGQLVTFGPEKDEGKSQKNNGDGGNVEQPPPSQPQKQLPPQQPPKHQQQKRLGTFGYGYGYN